MQWAENPEMAIVNWNGWRESINNKLFIAPIFMFIRIFKAILNLKIRFSLLSVICPLVSCIKI